MHKEIVIAAHNEIINWIPEDLKNISLIYRCGEPEKRIDNKIKNNFRHKDDFYSDLERLEALFNLYKKVNNIEDLNDIPEDPEDPEDPESIIKVKQTENSNKAREAKQWLNHIITRYNCLADTTIFLQGCPFDHCRDILQIIKNLNEVCFTTLPPARITDQNQEMIHDFWSSLTGQIPGKLCWSPGAQFAVHKSVILSKPLDWYLRIDELASVTSRSGEILERSWWNVFGEPEVTEIPWKSH
jgi:hypothetical protein